MQDNEIALVVSKTARYPVLDALRFVLAFWVVLGHLGVFPLFAWADTTTRLGRNLVHGWSSAVFATPAVIGFFIISGFCIHLPFHRASQTLPVGPYYARRYTRILIPMAGSLIVLRYLSGKSLHLVGADSILWTSIFWSLFCEEIYYAFYPLLRWLRIRLGWNWLLGGTFVVGVAISFSHRYAPDWSTYGPMGTALVLLPSWLLGCILAEQVDALKPNRSPYTIWVWRFSVWFASWVCEMLFFKFRVSYTHTMILFGILAYFWIKNEIANGLNRAPWKFLASAGAWSYSLYLLHEQAATIYDRLRFPNMGAILNWSMLYGFVLVTAYLFYLLVERPSHQMARKIKLRETKTVGIVNVRTSDVPIL